LDMVMTVVAAVQLQGIPTLIGDFLITDSDRRRPHFPLPTLQDTSNPFNSTAPLRIAGIRRKCFIVNDRLAVAFTGHVPAGKRVFSTLAHRFGKTNVGPTLQELDEILGVFGKPFHDQNLIATVIGWTVRSRPCCFSWSAGLGKHVEQVGGAIEGSGRDSFRKSLTEPRIRGTPTRTAYESAAIAAVLKVGRVLSDELLSSQNLAVGYGFGAEVALFTGRKFRFVPKIGYFFWNIQVDLDGSVTLRPANRAVIYQDKGEYALVNVLQLQESVVQWRTERRFLLILAPLHDDLLNLRLQRSDEPDILCPYYFLGFVVHDFRTGNRTRANLATDSHSSLFKIVKRDGGYRY
jgi:hypothetical protein